MKQSKRITRLLPKRIAGLLLAFCLVLALFPAAGFADSGGTDTQTRTWVTGNYNESTGILTLTLEGQSTVQKVQQVYWMVEFEPSKLLPVSLKTDGTVKTVFALEKGGNTQVKGTFGVDADGALSLKSTEKVYTDAAGGKAVANLAASAIGQYVSMDSRTVLASATFLVVGKNGETDGSGAKYTREELEKHFDEDTIVIPSDDTALMDRVNLAKNYAAIAFNDGWSGAQRAACYGRQAKYNPAILTYYEMTNVPVVNYPGSANEGTGGKKEPGTGESVSDNSGASGSGSGTSGNGASGTGSGTGTPGNGTGSPDTAGKAGSDTAPPSNTGASGTPSNKPDVTGKTFLDVSSGDWFYGAVMKLAKDDIVAGVAQEDSGGRPTGAYRFQPEDNVTRAEFVSMLAKAAGADLSKESTKVFNDVSAADWYAGAAAWASRTGVASGTGDGGFSPNINITRQDMAVMISKFVSSKEKTLTAKNERAAFTDASQIEAYAAEAVEAMQTAGIISGIPNENAAGKGAVTFRFSPFENAARAEAAAMLNGLLNVL